MEFILASLFINNCSVFYVNNCKSTFAPPCVILLCGLHNTQQRVWHCRNSNNMFVDFTWIVFMQIHIDNYKWGMNLSAWMINNWLSIVSCKGCFYQAAHSHTLQCSAILFHLCFYYYIFTFWYTELSTSTSGENYFCNLIYTECHAALHYS